MTSPPQCPVIFSRIHRTVSSLVRCLLAVLNCSARTWTRYRLICRGRREHQNWSKQDNSWHKKVKTLGVWCIGRTTPMRGYIQQNTEQSVFPSEVSVIGGWTVLHAPELATGWSVGEADSTTAEVTKTRVGQLVGVWCMASVGPYRRLYSREYTKYSTTTSYSF